MLLPIGIFVFVLWLSDRTLTTVTYRGFGVAVLAWLGLKLVLAAWPAPKAPTRIPLKSVGVVITNYNEKPQAIWKCLVSVYEQTTPPEVIVFVDDCSRSRAGVRTVEAFLKTDLARRCNIPVMIHRQPQNMGKREGLGVGWRAMPHVDIYLCIDSDTEISQETVEEGIRAFADSRVVAATGACLARNAKANVLTRVENLRYVNAFYGEREALSRVGSVLCVSGAVAFWSARHAHLVLEEFLGQRIFGKPASVGDDRHMTSLLLPHGRIVFVPRAIAYTDVPTDLKHYRKQQIRWGRSFWWESLLLLRALNIRRAYWWLCLGDLAFGAGAAVNLLWILADLALTHHFHFGQYVWLSFIWAYARSSYILAAPKRVIAPGFALQSFAISGLNTILSTFLVTPLRIWSAATLWNVEWGTRDNTGPMTGAIPVVAPEVVIQLPAERAATGSSTTDPLKR
jgi:hyaluronan synthase